MGIGRLLLPAPGHRAHDEKRRCLGQGFLEPQVARIPRSAAAEQVKELVRKLIGVLAPIGLSGIEQDLELPAGVLDEAEKGPVVAPLDHEGIELVGLEMAPELTGGGITDRLDVPLAGLEAGRLHSIGRWLTLGGRILLLGRDGSGQDHEEHKQGFPEDHGILPVWRIVKEGLSEPDGQSAEAWILKR